MIIYLIVLFVIASCAYTFDYKGRRRGKLQWERIVVFVLILLAGLRNHVGTDSISYEYTFYHNTPYLGDFLNNPSWMDLREPVWALFMSACKTFFRTFVFLQIIHATLLNVLLYRFYKKTTDKVFTALLVTFLVSWFGLNFEILRQSLCMAIFLNAIFLLKEKRILLYILLSIIIFGIHNFSIVMAALAPLVLYTRKEVFYPILVVVLILVVFFVDETVINMFFLQAEDFTNENMQEKINAYTNYSRYGYVNLNANGLIKLSLFSVLLPLSIVLLNKGKNNMVSIDSVSNRNYYQLHLNELLNMFIFLYMVFGVFSAKLNILFRLQQYLLPFVFVAAVNLIYRKYKKSFLTLFFWFLFSIFVIDSVSTLIKPSTIIVNSPVPYDTRYFPYTSVFEEEDPLRERMWGVY